MEPRIRTVAIVGVGLIGGSFSLALRKAGFAGSIIGVSSPRTIEQALRLNVIDYGATMQEAAAQSDLIYLSQPISKIIEAIPELRDSITSNKLVTDAGSTKAQIARVARENLPEGTFLGGHPMAGKESRGVESADASLFEGRTYILTPMPEYKSSVLQHEFEDWLNKIGAKVLYLTPEEHDTAVAYTSHLAQLASTALAATVSNRLTSTDLHRTAGPGLQDMTRLAMSSFEIWRDILDTNPEAISSALDEYISVLQRVRSTIGSPEIEGTFAAGARFAQGLRSARKIS